MFTHEAYIQFSAGLEKHIFRTFGTVFQEIAAEEQAVISKHLEALDQSLEQPSKAGSEIRLKIPTLASKRNLLKYAILSWYIPEVTRWELQEFIRNRAISLHFPEVAAYCYSKEVMTYLLYSENDLKHSDLFGNILQRGIYIYHKDSSGDRVKVKIDDFVSLTLKYRSKPKKKVFRRGYNDHGSLADSSKKAIQEEEGKELGQQQLEIELRRVTEKLQLSNLINQTLLSLQDLEGID